MTDKEALVEIIHDSNSFKSPILFLVNKSYTIPEKLSEYNKLVDAKDIYNFIERNNGIHLLNNKTSILILLKNILEIQVSYDVVYEENKLEQENILNGNTLVDTMGFKIEF